MGNAELAERIFPFFTRKERGVKSLGGSVKSPIEQTICELASGPQGVVELDNPKIVGRRFHAGRKGDKYVISTNRQDVIKEVSLIE